MCEATVLERERRGSWTQGTCGRQGEREGCRVGGAMDNLEEEWPGRVCAVQVGWASSDVPQIPEW